VTELAVWRSTGPASHDLAFEAEMLEVAAAGRPSLAVASWPGPVVVLGYGQPVEDVDLGWCRERSIPVLRRLSGGTGVIHRGDLSLSLALPAEHPWAHGVVGLYDRFLDVLQPALASLGSPVDRLEAPARATRVRSPVCFFDQLADTLAVGGRKAVGCSQTRRRGGVLIHAAVLLGLEPALYARVFRVDRGIVEGSLAPALTGVGWATAAEALVDGFARALRWSAALRPRPRPGPVALAVYDRERWAPVPDDGIGSGSTELE
jgi:lipoate-protein ligase A